MEKPRIITAANFITDDKTNKVFVSSWIDKPTGNLDLTEDDKHLLKDEILKTGQFCGLLYNTTDIWARDYMPIQLTDDLFLSYTYKPDYLNKYPTSVTNWQLHGVSTKDNKLGYPELDKEACAQINEAFSQVKDRSCVRLICVDMTHVVAEMNDFFNSGGALNCLTWTILSKQDIADRALPDGWSG